MANNPSTLPGYNGQTAAPDENYTYGSARDDAAPGDLTGTPRIAAEMNDILGAQQALLNAALVVPSGSPDTALVSQYLKASRIVAGNHSGHLFATVAGMVAGVTADGEEMPPVAGQTYYTLAYNAPVFQEWEVVAGLGGDYGVAISGGLFAKEISDSKTVLNFGAFLDGTASDTAFLDMLTHTGSITMPAAASGELYLTNLPDLGTFDSGDRIDFIGAGLEQTILQVTQAAPDTLFDNFRNYAKFVGFTVQEVDAAGGNTTTLGKCWDNSAGGSAFVLWDDLRVIGFDVIGEVRQSIWCNVGTIECTSYNTSPLNFVRTLKGGGAPTQGWNFFPSGWFNNALTVKNYLSRNGVNGPIFEGSSISIDTLTTEGLTGDGARFRGNSPSDKMHLCTVQNLYFENVVGNGFVAEDVNSLTIENLFQQGKDMVVASDTVFTADEANVTINKVFGQEWFTNGAILSNNSTLRGEVTGAIVGGSANLYVIDPTSRHIDNDETPHIKKWKSVSLAAGQSLTCVDAFTGTSENLALKIGVFYDGNPFEVQAWSLWVPSGGAEKIQQSTNGSNRAVGVTKSGDDLVITNNQGALSMIFNVTLVNETDLAIDGK